MYLDPSLTYIHVGRFHPRAVFPDPLLFLYVLLRPPILDLSYLHSWTFLISIFPNHFHSSILHSPYLPLNCLVHLHPPLPSPLFFSSRIYQLPLPFLFPAFLYSNLHLFLIPFSFLLFFPSILSPHLSPFKFFLICQPIIFIF